MASQLLLETLDDLGKDNFEKFKWYLSHNILEGCTPIPLSYLENASRIDTVSRMTERYCEESAVSVSIVILKKMNMNNAAEMLKNKYAAAGGETAPTSSSSSSASAPPAAPASISAVDGAVVNAPTFTACNVASLNITINKT